MSTTLEKQDVRQDLNNPTRMVHVSYDRTPHVALCGAPLNGIKRPGSPVDCHVCAEIDRALA